MLCRVLGILSVIELTEKEEAPFSWKRTPVAGVFLEKRCLFVYGKMHSACLYGIEGVMIGVEVDLANGLPQTHIRENITQKIF